MDVKEIILDSEMKEAYELFKVSVPIKFKPYILRAMRFYGDRQFVIGLLWGGFITFMGMTILLVWLKYA